MTSGMSTTSDIVSAFDRWLARGLEAAAVMDVAGLERCTTELEELALGLESSDDDDKNARIAALGHIRTGVARWRELCLLAARTIEETLTFDARGSSTSFYVPSGAARPSALHGRLVKSYG
jgi:hypothetical protein